MISKIINIRTIEAPIFPALISTKDMGLPGLPFADNCLGPIPLRLFGASCQ